MAKSATQAKENTPVIATVTPIKPVPAKAKSISLKIGEISTTAQFTKLFDRLASSYDFSTGAVQAMMPFILTCYANGTFDPLNKLDDLIATKKGGVTLFRKYIKRHSNAEYNKDSKAWERKGTAKKSTIKSLVGTWKMDAETVEQVQERAAEALASGNEAEATRLGTKAKAMEVKAEESSKVSGLHELIKTQAKLAKSVNEGTAKHEAINAFLADRIAGLVDEATVMFASV